MDKPLSLYEHLRDRVVNGEFAPGEKLKSEALCADYGCSATTIREVLFRLSTVGLVEFQEQRGFRLPQCSDALRHDLAHFRILLESEGACLSIRQGGVGWESRLAASHHKLSHIESRVRGRGASTELLTLWSAAESEFHTTLIDACGSPTLMRSHAVVYQQFRQQMIWSDNDFEFVGQNVIQHRGILDAALAHDEALVRQRIHDHLARNLIQPLPAPARLLPVQAS